MENAFSKKNHEAGVTLLSTIVGISVVVVGIYALVEVSSSMLGLDTRTQKRVGGEQMLASILLDFEKISADRLAQLCSSIDAFNKTPTSRCTNSTGTDLTGLPLVVANIPTKIGVRLGWNSNPDANGPFCADLVSCKWRGGEHLLEVVVNGSWIIPQGGTQPKHLANRQLTLRRSR